MAMTEKRDKEERSARLIQGEPTDLDILCGRDKPCTVAPGTLRFRDVIASFGAYYAEALTKFDKMRLTRTVYELLTNTSSRFLKYNSKRKGWEELSALEARDKISHALRFSLRRKKTAHSPVANSSTFTRTALPLPTAAPIIPPTLDRATEHIQGQSALQQTNVVSFSLRSFNQCSSESQQQRSPSSESLRSTHCSTAIQTAATLASSAGTVPVLSGVLILPVTLNQAPERTDSAMASMPAIHTPPLPCVLPGVQLEPLSLNRACELNLPGLVQRPAAANNSLELQSISIPNTNLKQDLAIDPGNSVKIMESTMKLASETFALLESVSMSSSLEINHAESRLQDAQEEVCVSSSPVIQKAKSPLQTPTGNMVIDPQTTHPSFECDELLLSCLDSLLEEVSPVALA